MSKDIKLIAQEVSRLSKVVSAIEANYSRRIAVLEARLEIVLQSLPVMDVDEMLSSMEAVAKEFEEIGE